MLRPLWLSLPLLLALSAPIAIADEDPDRVAVPTHRPGIGQLVQLRQVTDVDGATHRLDRRTVVLMTSPTCPLSKKYGPAIARLSAREHVVMVGVEGDGEAADLRRFAADLGFKGVVVHDPKRKLARVLGATTTTEAFLIDRTGTLIYRGALDDQYGIGYARDAARRTYLADAIKALAAGRAPAVPTTSAPGCKLGLTSAEPAPEKAPTWHGSVQRIVQRRCQSCHRPGAPGPFSLLEPKDLTSRAAMIRYVVRDGLMPPWFARKRVGHWRNDASLTDREKRVLEDWLSSEKPAIGDPARAPRPRVWPKAGSWRIKPDHVFQIPKPVEVKTEGRMPYVNVRVKVPFTEDRWISAWEIKPTAPDVVHHALIFLVRPGDRLSVGGAAGQLAGYAPGSGHAVYPAGLGKRIPGGSELHFQIHYTPIGKQRTDQLQFGVTFSKTKPRHELATLAAAQIGLRIPPNTEAHEERASITIKRDAVLLAFTPHMHYRGKSFRYELIEKGKRTTLLDVPRYDFNWQLSYMLARPLRVSKGSKIVVTAVFDNSRSNPSNPDPDKTVYWGEQTDDEMLLGYIAGYYPGIPAGEPIPKRAVSASERWFLSHDKNKDNVLSKEECPPLLRASFGIWDINKDGKLSQSELTRMSHVFRRKRKKAGKDGDRQGR